LRRYVQQRLQQYHVDRRSTHGSLKRKAVKTRFQAVTPQPKSNMAANVMDVSFFLARYLSGNQNVVVAPGLLDHFSTEVSSETRFGRTVDVYRINVPAWNTFNLPLDEFEKYRIYRHGVYHEAMHVKYTPPEIFSAFQGDPLRHDLTNIIEDKRIEDLGQEEWPGYKPERMFTQAWAYIVRPDVSKIPDRDTAVYEAFLQRLLVGKVKGSLPKSEMDKVEDAAETVEEELERIKGESSSVVAHTIKALTEHVAKTLGFSGIFKPPTYKPTSTSWDDTFNPKYVENQGKTKGNVAKDVEEYFKEAEKKAKKVKPGEETEHGEVTVGDVERARKGAVEVHEEYRNAKKGEMQPPELSGWVKPASRQPPSPYRDDKFISQMQTQLRFWRQGYVEVVGKSGARFSVPDYIRTQMNEPFATRIKKSAKGRKLLVLADLSGSMLQKQDEYKKALISTMEVLDGIGVKTALFTFGEDPAQGNGFYMVKAFEEPKWTGTHAAKLAALRAGYPCTPTDQAYRALKNYIKKHRPHVTVTVTDGEPDSVQATAAEVKELKKDTEMVAYGIAENAYDKTHMENSLKKLGYHSSFAVSDVHEIPPKFVKLVAPT